MIGLLGCYDVYVIYTAVWLSQNLQHNLLLLRLRRHRSSPKRI
nr:MAG TPA: hypothetical protein [Caudoviricetes sp.]